MSEVLLAILRPESASDMLEMLKSHKDVQARWLADGLEAYTEATRKQPRLLIVDVLLPSLNGLALTRLLKFHEDHRGVRVLVVGGDAAVRAQAAEAGADACLPRPFEPEAFHGTVRHLLAETV